MSLTIRILNHPQTPRDFLKSFLLIGIFCFLPAQLQAQPAGSLDPSFGAGGKVTTDIANSPDTLNTIALQPDGKILVGGRSDIQTGRVTAIVRYNPNGSLDTNFDGDGKVTTDVTGGFEEVVRLLVQPDGKIVSAVRNGTSGPLALVRYNANGSLDASFGTNGTVLESFIPMCGVDNRIELKSAELQADGKILVTGGCSFDFFLARFNPNGSVDTGFGTNGLVRTDFVSTATARSITLQADGKIILAGRVEAGTFSSGMDFALARYNTDGSLDQSFGTRGIRVINVSGGGFDDEANFVTTQPGGKIVVAGFAYSEVPNQNSFEDFAIVRLNPNGSLDTSFDGNGIVTTAINGSTMGIQREDDARVVRVLPDGKIVAAGLGKGSEPNIGAVVRYNADGSLDTSFGANGIVRINVGINGVTAMILQPDGKIVAAGGLTFDFEVVRLLGDLAAPRRTAFDFDGDGRADVSVYRPSEGIWYLLQSTQGFSAARWGNSTDKIMPADYDGDGKTDLAIFRRGENSTWYILNSATNTFRAVQWGATNFEQQLLLYDTPVPADYDGDGKTDLAVWRLTDNLGEPARFLILQSSNNEARVQQWGNFSDRPVPADFDGDNRADLAVYRGGTWYILQSADNSWRVVQFGLGQDKTVAADYDGDGKADLAVYRGGTWYLLQSSQGFTAFQFGLADDVPTPADYDGDGKTDVAVYRDGVWHMLRSSDGGFATQNFGAIGDVAVPSAYVPL